MRPIAGARRTRLAVLLALALGAASCSPGGAARPEATQAAAVATTGPSPAAVPVGSERCAPCHAKQTAEWKASWHSRTLRVADVDDEERLASLAPCSDMEATHALGGRHELRFLVEERDAAWGAGRWLALPCGYDVHQKSLKSHHPEDWRQRPAETSCTPCHVTRHAADLSFAEPAVGCEACHGPGSEHVAAPTKATIFTFTGRTAAEEVTVCASCHLQGGVSKRTGLPFPDGYTPGSPLFDDYLFDWSKLDVQDANEAIDVHQKLLVREVALHGTATLRCTSCHELHAMGHDKHQALPRQDACLTCHEEATYKLKEYRQSCPVCEF